MPLHFFTYNPFTDEIIDYSYEPVFGLYQAVIQKKYKDLDRDVNILFTVSKFFKDEQFYKSVAESFNVGNKIAPLITIGYYPLHKQDDHVIFIDTHLPKLFFDSSIWNYYITVEGSKSFSKKIESVLKIISHSYNEQLYSLVVAREFIEFNYRLLANSYLESPSGHGDFVTPFLFHSEHEMKKGTVKIFEEFKNIFGYKYAKIKWTILLVDDYSLKILRTIDGESHNNKNKIINYILKEFIKNTNNNLPNYNNTVYKYNFEFRLINVEKDTDENIGNDIIKKSINYLKDKEKPQIDIILLDYLLGYNNEDKREFGEEFLRKLEEEKENIKIGPFGRGWIFPISSFNQAMLSKLNETGTNKIQDTLYILDGADVINTPNLFLYYFFKLLELQLKQAIITKKEILKFIVNNFNNKEDTRLVIRQMYGTFMHKFGMQEQLKLDNERGSAFAKSVLEYAKNNLEDYLFYEYMHKLLYLVGYGTHYKAPRMWDLLKQVEANLNHEEKDKIKGFLKNVLKYITKFD